MRLMLGAMLTAPTWAFAYVVGSTTPGKWGSPVLGTGATVTWSVMGGGVSCAAELSGCTTTALTSLLPSGFLGQIQQAFDAWSAVANIDFLQVSDDGAALDAPTHAGDIRIGARSIDGGFGTLAYAYYPPLNGVSAAGDIFLDTAENWTIGFDGQGYDVFQVLAHEIGHAIGLDHVTDSAALMNARYTEDFRGPQADDIAGARFLYGTRLAEPVPEPSTLMLIGAGLFGVATTRRRTSKGSLATQDQAHGPGGLRLDSQKRM